MERTPSVRVRARDSVDIHNLVDNPKDAQAFFGLGSIEEDC